MLVGREYENVVVIAVGVEITEIHSKVQKII